MPLSPCRGGMGVHFWHFWVLSRHLLTDNAEYTACSLISGHGLGLESAAYSGIKFTWYQVWTHRYVWCVKECTCKKSSQVKILVVKNCVHPPDLTLNRDCDMNMRTCLRKDRPCRPLLFLAFHTCFCLLDDFLY